MEDLRRAWIARGRRLNDGRTLLAKHFLPYRTEKNDRFGIRDEKIARSSSRSRLGVKCIRTKHVTMKSKKNLTRFTYESAAFEGWRLCISRAGTTFTRYFPDKKFGGGKKSLAAAEKALADLKALVDGSKRVDGKLSPATIKKAEKLLAEAV
jgi:hypothetical protein